MIEMLRPTLAQEGFEMEVIHLAELDIRCCTGCGFCMEKGECWIDDDYRQATEKLMAAQGIILASPVYFLSVTGQMKTFLDRSLAFGHKPSFTWKPGLAVSVSAGLAERKSPGYLRWVRVQHKDGVRLIPVEEVCYFQASDKYTLVITKGSDSLIRKTIQELAGELDPNQFWQIHRGTIVNASCIAQVGRSLTGRGVVRLKDRPDTLTVSHRYNHKFKQM